MTEYESHAGLPSQHPDPKENGDWTTLFKGLRNWIRFDLLTK
jgi:hypothetical protein